MLGPREEAVERRIQQLISEDAAARIWRRDAAFWGGDAHRAASVASRLGWLDVAATMRRHLPELDTFAREVRDTGFTDAVLLGMGGSSLAPEVLRRCVERDESFPRLHVLDTTDPVTIARTESRLDLARTLFIVSSKSGGTIEPNVLFAHFHDRVAAALRGAPPGPNFVAITDSGTSLQALAAERGFGRVFVNPSDIGGRYSALSYFGLVPAAVCGIDVHRLLDRAIAAMDAARAPGSDALRLGAALGELARLGCDKATFLISSEYASFALWLEQLIAESTGKEGVGVLPVADEPEGSPHKYGVDRVFVQIRGELGNDAEQDALAGALAAEGYPLAVIDIDDAYDLAGQMVAWEYAVAVVGHVLGINPFDEPNVQESKDNTNRVLAELERSAELDAGLPDAAPCALLTWGPQDDAAAAVRHILDQIGARDYLAITSYLPETAATTAICADMRAIVRDALGCATTLGYGPRFLHSTGQLHKGGPPEGVFLQLTAADERDLAIPGRPFTFGQLKRAQAIGDFQSLAAHGRPVLRVHLGHDVPAGLEWLHETVRAALQQPVDRGR